MDLRPVGVLTVSVDQCALVCNGGVGHGCIELCSFFHLLGRKQREKIRNILGQVGVGLINEDVSFISIVDRKKSFLY
jgi:hypothetical protein